MAALHEVIGSLVPGLAPGLAAHRRRAGGTALAISTAPCTSIYGHRDLAPPGCPAAFLLMLI